MGCRDLCMASGGQVQRSGCGGTEACQAAGQPCDLGRTLLPPTLTPGTDREKRHHSCPHRPCGVPTS
uniref:Uncharacterized protein n=1 Tax=Desmodus rotundus TaxID=9430 RepID=K9IXS3_DESRO